MKTLGLCLLVVLCYACNTTAPKTDTPAPPSVEQVNQVNVQMHQADKLELNLANKMKPQRIETSFESLGVEYLCTLNAEENICVYAFDTKKKTLTEMLAFLGHEVGVESASKTKGCP